MSVLLRGYFERTVKKGSLDLTFASGETVHFGDDDPNEPRVAARFTDKDAERQLMMNPGLAFGELYMDGRFLLDEGDLIDFVTLMKINGFRRHLPAPYKLVAALPYLANMIRNLVRSSSEKRQVAHHYDIDTRLFELFLDDDLQYTCALYDREDMTLEEAQMAKKRHVTAKLLVKPEHRVLELGCGWGGLAMYIAELTGAHVTGVNLSGEQVDVAKKRAAKRGLDERVKFIHQNYRDAEGHFDRIVSVGMMEHVGKGNYDILFKKTYDMLDKRGVAVFHSIGRPKPALGQPGFNEKYIFPGGYIPSVGEVVPEIERAGFIIKDIEILSMHYAWTLRDWRRAFMKNWGRAAELFDERFCRMWEFYLVVSESAFRHDRLMIMHYQLAKHQDIVPYTRDYILREKARLEKLEAEKFGTQGLLSVG